MHATLIGVLTVTRYRIEHAWAHRQAAEILAVQPRTSRWAADVALNAEAWVSPSRISL